MARDDRLDKLLARLNISGMRAKDTPLYEVIAELIKRVKELSTETASVTPGDVVTNITEIHQRIDLGDGGGGDGDIGPPGIRGADGATGATGAQGPPFPAFIVMEQESEEIPLPIPGPKGDTGAIGPTGPAGASFPFMLPEPDLGEDSITVIRETGGGGGGGGTSSGTEAALPASGADGELYLPTDGVQIHRYDGSAWSPWGPIFPFTKPIDGDFAWVNQETASVDTTKGGIFLSDVAGGVVANDLRIRIKSAPSTPYVITAAFIPNTYQENFFQFGLCFREAATGELHAFSFTHATTAFTLGWGIWSRKFNSPTSFNSEYTNHLWEFSGKIVFIRIADNGVNRICSFSFDGQNWVQFHSVGRTDFLTADQVGFFIDVANTSFGYSTTLVHWKES